MAENDGPASPRASIGGLAKQLGQLPADKKRVALEMSASLAGVSLRVSREFVEAVPKAADLLSADDLRHWSELGRRLAMGSAESGAAFFRSGVEGLRGVPESSRTTVFQICTRQLVISSSIAVETFASIPQLAAEIEDKGLLAGSLALAADIAHRSAKHSVEFLRSTPAVAVALGAYDKNRDVAASVIALASLFAARTGGMTAELWAKIPKALDKLSARDAADLMTRAAEFLEFGGSVTLHFVMAGSKVLRRAAGLFSEWCGMLRVVAPHGNAVLISFLRSTPAFFADLPLRKPAEIAAAAKVIQLTSEIAGTDAESALAAFRSSASALEKVSLTQFEEWIEAGLNEKRDASAKARRSYFALETRRSNEMLGEASDGLPLERVQGVLRIYIEALTGKHVQISPLSAIPRESRIGDGETIYLPSNVAEFEDDSMDFRLYKVLAAHGAGQIEFGTFEIDTPALRAAFADLSERYSATSDETDAFSLSGYIEDRGSSDAAPLFTSQESSESQLEPPENSNYNAVLQLFPEPRLARKIFSTMENARIDNRLRASYRGLRKDLDLLRDLLSKTRPYIFDVPMREVPFELLFQITLCGGATDDARKFYGQIVSEIEGTVELYATLRNATVADSLMATSRIYSLFQNISPEQSQETNDSDSTNEFIHDEDESGELVNENKIDREATPKNALDIRDLFSAWNSLDDEGQPDDLQGSEAWSHRDMPEQDLESGEVAFAYDEWDRELNDYRVGWSRVIEKKVKQGDRNFVELTRSRYRGVISSIRHQFQLMKPENLTRINRELDGEDYDLNALVDFVVDRKADGHQSENIYTKRLRKMRDVAVSILLDQSSSTARTITRNPLQPYTYPGRRIIEIEKEGLVLMSEALEAVGDSYSISGFTSEGRRNVKFYVVKEFGEKYSDEIEKRIGGITFQNNTRLGAAIRHASAKLLRQDERTKLLIILTDGRPYDHDYGDARYAREDVREALTEAKASGVTPFCITVDRESESELKELYGDIGYTIIDDVLSLPERMPNIYRRLTS